MKIYSTTSTVGFAYRLKDFQPLVLNVFDSLELSVSLENKEKDNSEECILFGSIVNQNDFIELLLILSALRHYKSINLILTYLFYARQDEEKKFKSVGASVIQRALEFENVSKIYHIDTHSNFFTKPNEIFYPDKLFSDDIRNNQSFINPIIIVPDLRAEMFAKKIAKILNLDCLVLQKERKDKEIKCYGDLEKVYKRDCIIVDDMIDTGSTILYTANELKNNHCGRIVAYCTHGVLSQDSIVNLKKSYVEEVVITDSVYRLVPDPAIVRRLSLYPLLKEIVDCI